MDKNERRFLADRRTGTFRRKDDAAVVERFEQERQETVSELLDLISVIQEMGRRLAEESHGDRYSSARELNEKLHEARVIITRIQEAK